MSTVDTPSFPHAAMAIADKAVAAIRTKAPNAKPRIGVILGSGWAGVTAHIQGAVRIPYTDIPDFPQPTVQGHVPELWLGRMSDVEVAVLAGRKHSYETGHARGMVVPIRTLKALGCEVLVQTNAAGSTNAAMGPGSLMAISDHLNLPQLSPLVGEEGSERFVPLADAYDVQLREQAVQIAKTQGVPLHEGVYAWFLGPHFETPAEIRMAQRMGADGVGMSTVPETIIARHIHMRVLALSLMTNMGAGLSDESLSHAHTLAQAQAAGQTASQLLAAVIAQIRL